jgi:cell division septal protein FtsQ
VSSRRSSIFVLIALLGVLGVAGGWLYSRNSLFRLAEVQVESERADLDAEIRRRLAGILGRSLFTLSLRQLESELAALPAVESVSLHRRWPSTLLIRVREREAVGMAFRNGKLWTYDASGEPIEALRRPLATPLVRGVVPGTPQAKDIYAWLARARKSEPGLVDLNEMDEAEWVNDRGLIVRFLARNLEVEMGFAGFDEAWRRFERALAAVRERQIEATYFDATYRHRVVVRGRSVLQNPSHSLDLKGLVRRTTGGPVGGR